MSSPISRVPVFHSNEPIQPFAFRVHSWLSISFLQRMRFELSHWHRNQVVESRRVMLLSYEKLSPFLTYKRPISSGPSSTTSESSFPKLVVLLSIDTKEFWIWFNIDQALQNHPGKKSSVHFREVTSKMLTTCMEIPHVSHVVRTSNLSRKLCIKLCIAGTRITFEYNLNCLFARDISLGSQFHWRIWVCLISVDRVDYIGCGGNISLLKKLILFYKKKLHAKYQMFLMSQIGDVHLGR